MRTARVGGVAVATLMAGMLSLSVAPASGQGVKIVAPPPASERPAVRTHVPSSPGDEIYYPGHGPTVPHDPAIILPFNAPSRDSRMGVAGWTSPNMPVGASGAGLRDHNGSLALGFAWRWGSSTPTRETRAPAASGPGVVVGSYASPGVAGAPAAPELKTR